MRWTLAAVALAAGCSHANTNEPAPAVSTPPLASAGSSPLAAAASPPEAGDELFQAAEQKRAEAEGIRLPPFQGPRTREAVLAHMKGEVATWLKRRLRANQEAEQAYARAREARPGPSPGRVVASFERTGRLWESLESEFQTLPIPEEFDRDPARRAAYREAVSEGASVSAGHARRNYESCAEVARRERVASEHSERCAAWLKANPAP